MSEANKQIISDLELIANLSSRVSHDLRTPLGTALSVLRDHCTGQTLELQDYQDAKNALEKLLGGLELLKGFSKKASNCFDELDLSLFIRQQYNESWSDKVDLLSKDKEKPEVFLIDCDRILLSCAFAAIISYLVDRINQHYKTGSEQKRKPGLHWAYERNKLSVSFTLPGAIAEEQSLLDFAREERSLSGFGLLYAAKVIELHGGRARVGLISTKDSALAGFEGMWISLEFFSHSIQRNSLS